ncbi:MAG: hypothetical protein AAF078_08000 [Planctomycetota bacterium]
MTFIQPNDNDRLVLSGRSYKRIAGATRAYEAENGIAESSPSSGPLSLPSSQVWVRNDHTATVPRGGVLVITGPIIEPADNVEEQHRHPSVTGVAPATADLTLGRIVVLREPLASGRIGKGYAAGVCPAQINVSDASHAFADVADSTTDHLVSSAEGPLSILWKETGTGTVSAMVRFGAGVNKQLAIARITGEGLDGYYQLVEVDGQGVNVPDGLVWDGGVGNLNEARELNGRTEIEIDTVVLLRRSTATNGDELWTFEFPEALPPGGLQYQGIFRDASGNAIWDYPRAHT